jgi:DUF971 family protein
MMTTELFPNSIQANKKISELYILWNDGHESHYPFWLLRAACPCASCRGGHENMQTEPDSGVFDNKLPESSATRIKLIEPVGSYALTITWEDGHHFGIFNWHYLRALCPCEICRNN